MATMQYVKYPPDNGGGGGSGNITDINGSVGPSISIVGGTGISVGTVGTTITVTNTSPVPTGTPQQLAYFNPSGVLSSAPGISSSENGEINSFLVGTLSSTNITSLNLGGTINTPLSNGYNGLLLSSQLSSTLTYDSGFVSQRTYQSGFNNSGNNSTFNDNNILNSGSTHNGYNSFASFPQLNGDITGSYYGLSISPSSSGTINNAVGININLSNITSNDPQGVTGIQSDSRIQVNAVTELVSAQQFQIGSRIENLFHVPSGSPVTGTDSLGLNLAGDLWAEDDIALGPIGLGFNSVGFIASVAVSPGKTVDSITAFLPAVSLQDPGSPTGGNVTNMNIIRVISPVPSGGSLNITNLYGLKIDNFAGPLSAAATNTWGLYIEDINLQNYIGGRLGIGITTPSARIHISGVTTSAGSAPIKIDSGTLMTTPENGAVESDGTDLYWTDNTGTRQILNGGGSSTSFGKETFVLSGTDITNQYIDLTQVAKTNSIAFLIQGSEVCIEGASYDYSVSYTGGAGGKTRLTFLNGIATGGVSALVASDIVQINYAY